MPFVAHLPGVDQFDTGVLKVIGVASCQCRADGAAYGRDLCVGHADRPSQLLPAGDDVGVPVGGGLIEAQNPAVEVVAEQPVNCGCQFRLAVPAGHPCDAIEQFSGGDRGRGNLSRGQRV